MGTGREGDWNREIENSVRANKREREREKKQIKTEDEYWAGNGIKSLRGCKVKYNIM